MGVPKRRVSHARQGDRRSHHALTMPQLEECPHCHSRSGPPRLPELRLVRRPRGVRIKVRRSRPERAPPSPLVARRSRCRRISTVRDDLEPGSGRPDPGRGRRDGRRPRARGGRRGRLDWAAANPDTDLLLVGDEPRARAAHRPDAPTPNLEVVHASETRGHGRAARRRRPPQARREHQRLHAPRPRRTRRRGRHRRPHGCRRGVGDPQPGPPAGRRPAGARRPDGHRQGALRAARHRRHDRLDRPQPCPVRAHGRDLRRAGAGRRRADRRAAVDRRGGRQGRAARPGGDRAHRGQRLRFVGNVEGRDLPRIPPTSSSATRRWAT